MGVYDAAQIAGLIGIYIFDTLSRMVNLVQIGLYRDDWIIFIPDSNGPQTSKIHKNVIRVFKLQGLRIEIDSNMKIVDFLDVTLSLDNGTFKPFSKINFTSAYIDVNSNHSRSRFKQIPDAVNQRINIWGERIDL